MEDGASINLTLGWRRRQVGGLVLLNSVGVGDSPTLVGELAWLGNDALALKLQLVGGCSITRWFVVVECWTVRVFRSARV